MKTIINLLLGAILLACLLSSCRKEGSTGQRVWEGRVLEYGSDKPVAGATVYLLEVRGEILGPSGSRVVDSLVSDGAGRFTFRYADNPQASHRIRARADQYHEQEVSAGSNRSKITKDITLDPHAWVRIHVKNANPINQNDFLSLNTNNCSERAFLGADVDLSITCQYRGNRRHSFTYTIIRSGKGEEKSIFEFSAGARDTLEYDLFY